MSFSSMFPYNTVNPYKLDSLYKGISLYGWSLSIPNMACGPKSTYSYINNLFKPESPFNQHFCLARVQFKGILL